jgi:hypothetical protein
MHLPAPRAKLDPQNHMRYSRYVSRIYNFISPIHIVFTPGGTWTLPEQVDRKISE